jgi:hypothetical protein
MIYIFLSRRDVVFQQILSQHCVYEAADNKKAFEYYIEKVKHELKFLTLVFLLL